MRRSVLVLALASFLAAGCKENPSKLAAQGPAGSAIEAPDLFGDLPPSVTEELIDEQQSLVDKSALPRRLAHAKYLKRTFQGGDGSIVGVWRVRRVDEVYSRNRSRGFLDDRDRSRLEGTFLHFNEDGTFYTTSGANVEGTRRSKGDEEVGTYEYADNFVRIYLNVTKLEGGRGKDISNPDDIDFSDYTMVSDVDTIETLFKIYNNRRLRLFRNGHRNPFIARTAGSTMAFDNVLVDTVLIRVPESRLRGVEIVE